MWMLEGYILYILIVLCTVTNPILHNYRATVLMLTLDDRVKVVTVSTRPLEKSIHNSSIKHLIYFGYIFNRQVALGVGSWTSNLTNAGSIPGD